ncbi:MAG: sulfurtransferase TusA [Gammaproteobacteria bacterium]|nr:sulfurtransferase TusA [Gammaproteobacteria bacterium]MCY4182763.1 sulfurtransferase TusA [Gammaproteobacteria bacterium]MCY4268801.1 sulfurtransferase TusA [Gammaproteobacteria bacterium]MCY4296318.1 sulfurtransferase TusA [Gammaproteobacteria bacterium]
MSNTPDSSLAAVAEVDARGLFCPEPVMLLHNRIRDVAAGQRLRITATDPSTTRDIPKFCLYLGHELIDQQKRDGEYIYLIRKKTG